MVWSVGMGRMKAFVRLLESGSFSKIVQPDDVKKKKLTEAVILGELDDANEPNLLDEKDMHVFGLNPMDDPLYLVSCNFCKKTINASQYASHAELCRYLGFQKACMEVAETGDGSGHKNPTRKRRNKVSRHPPASFDQAMITGKSVLLESTKVDYLGFKSNKEDPIGTVSSLSTVTDDSLDGMPKPDVSNFYFGTEDFSTSTASHLKRCKLKNATIAVESDERESRDAEFSRSQEEQTYRKSYRASAKENGNPDKKPLDPRMTNKYPSYSLPYDVPAPLATKIYYSQPSSHLRSALSLMFHKASEISSSSDVDGSEALEGNLTSPETSPILDELGNMFSSTKEPFHQTTVCGSSLSVRTADSFRTTSMAVSSSLNANNLRRPYTATTSVEMLNR